MPHLGAPMHQKCFLMHEQGNSSHQTNYKSLVLLMLKLVCSSRSIKSYPGHSDIFFILLVKGGVTSSHLGSTGSLFLNTELGQLLQLHQFYRVNTTSEGTEVWPEQKLSKTWPCHIVENLICGQFGELKDHLFCVCAVAILTAAETKPHCGKIMQSFV